MPEPLTLPPGSIVDFGELSSMISIMDRLKERDDADKVQAIRYQGQQDYSQMVAAGADPVDAMVKAAPKLFHQNPAGFAQVVEFKQRQDVIKQRAKFLETPEQVMTYDDEKFIRRPSSSGDYTLTHIPRPAAAKPPVSMLTPSERNDYNAINQQINRLEESLTGAGGIVMTAADKTNTVSRIAQLQAQKEVLKKKELANPFPLPGDVGSETAPVSAPKVSRVWNSETQRWSK